MTSNKSMEWIFCSLWLVWRLHFSGVFVKSLIFYLEAGTSDAILCVFRWITCFLRIDGVILNIAASKNTI